MWGERVSVERKFRESESVERESGEIVERELG